MKIILRVKKPEDAVLALRAAKSLQRDGYNDCVYGYDNGVHVWAKNNKASITATTSDYYDKT